MKWLAGRGRSETTLTRMGVKSTRRLRASRSMCRRIELSRCRVSRWEGWKTVKVRVFVQGHQREQGQNGWGRGENKERACISSVDAIYDTIYCMQTHSVYEGMVERGREEQQYNFSRERPLVQLCSCLWQGFMQVCTCCRNGWPSRSLPSHLILL